MDKYGRKDGWEMMRELTDAGFGSIEKVQSDRAVDLLAKNKLQPEDQAHLDSIKGIDVID